MDEATLQRASLHVVRVTDRTCWTFLRIHSADGRIGEGEATLQGREHGLRAAAERLVPAALREAAVAEPGAFAERHRPSDIQEASIVSALDQALWSLHAQARGQSLTQVLGALRERVPVYANINRRTRDRSPAGFASSAEKALAAGHMAFKLAPFDEVTPHVCAQGDGARAMGAGLERIAAVREVIGQQSRLMVDCHWRFDEATARALNEAAAKLAVHWIETPIPETEAGIPGLARLRRQCNELGMRQAGLETSIGWDAMRPYVEAGAYDVVMPDVKYMGGINEILRAAAGCKAHGVQVSPHNPSGPICHAASLQVSMALDAFDMLEMQFDESPLFDTLVDAPWAAVVEGCMALPVGRGLGAALSEAALRRDSDRPARGWHS